MTTTTTEKAKLDADYRHTDKYLRLVMVMFCFKIDRGELLFYAFGKPSPDIDHYTGNT